MCDVDFSFYDVDDLALLASELLDKFRKRGMPDTIQRRVIDTAHEANNLEKLRVLVAKFKAAIEAHDAEVAAAQAALSEHEPLAMQQASFSASSFSTAIPSSGATNGNPNGTEGNTNANSQESQPGAVPRASRCTIKVKGPYIRDQRRHQPITLVDAARSSVPGRKPSGDVRCHQEAWRQYAFEEGIKAKSNGRIDRVKLTELLDSYRALHPRAPPSLKSVIFRSDWLVAVQENDISRLVLSRTVPVVKTVDTIEEKLEKRPEMKYLFDWCVGWIQSEREQSRTPIFTRMDAEWNRRRERGEEFFQRRGPKYAQNSLNVTWKEFLDYEGRKAGSALTEEGGSDSIAEEGVSARRNDDAEPCLFQSLDSGAPGADWAAEPNGLDGGAPAAADAASAAADAASAAAADSGAGGGTSPALSAATAAAAAALAAMPWCTLPVPQSDLDSAGVACAASAAAADSGAERPPQIQNSATAAAAEMPPATPTAAASAEMGVEFFESMAGYDSSSEDDDKGEGNERPTGSDVGIEREDSNGGISAGAPLSRPHSSTVPAGAAATPAASTAAAAAVAAPPPPATAAAAAEAADAIDGGGGGESPDTEYAAAALAAQAAAGAPPSGPLRIAAAAVSADAAAVGVVGFSNLNPDGLGGGVPAAAYAREVTRDGDTSAAGHPVVASPTAPAATLPAFPTSAEAAAAGAASAEVAAPPPPAPLPPASPTAPAAAEAAAAESGLRSAPVAAGPAGAAGGSTPLAPAPHGVSIATVIQIGRAIPRTAASIIRYLWKALCFWGFSLFRYRAAISDSL
jgi:hypothetical protein